MLDPMKILREACEYDVCDAEDLELADAEEELYNEYNYIEELEDDDPMYTESMIPVFSTDSVYLVEADMLAKYMNSNSITDPNEAMTKIAESNQIDVDKMAVLVESVDYAEDIIEEAKSDKSKKSINKAVSTSKFLKNFKLKGIKVVKKKSKKK